MCFSSLLCQKSVSNGSTDNISVIVVFLQKPEDIVKKGDWINNEHSYSTTQCRGEPGRPLQDSLWDHSLVWVAPLLGSDPEPFSAFASQKAWILEGSQWSGLLVAVVVVGWFYCRLTCFIKSWPNMILLLLYSAFSPTFLCRLSALWIRIQIGSVFSSFVDPDPHSEYGSGSTQ